MESFLAALIEFITDVFAAFSEFFGWATDLEDLTTTTVAADAQ